MEDFLLSEGLQRSGRIQAKWNFVDISYFVLMFSKEDGDHNIIQLYVTG